VNTWGYGMRQYGRMDVSPGPPLLVIAGPTATGKTSLAIRVGRALLDAGRAVTVISADSRQVYRGLDIGTAKATPEERAGVPHAGLDLVDPPERFTVADFVRHVEPVLADLARADPPGLAILAGGTGLYLRAVARGLPVDDLPDDPAMRARLEGELAEAGLPALVARLERLAPTLAATIDRANPRRVVRALEHAEVRGDAPRPTPRGYSGPVTWLGLDVPAATHRAWIAARARAQFEAGLIDEAVVLRARYDPGLPCFSAIGYREAWAVVDGERTLEEAIADDAARNVAFARRQRTWFRSEPDITWLDPSAADPLPAALAAARALRSGR
jgi:tRNA dimethylallyltransferase